MEDSSSNGTAMDQKIIGRNDRRELDTADEISLLNQNDFLLLYPHDRRGNTFRRQYQVVQRIGKGSCATVYLCVEKSTEKRYAVKRFVRARGELENLHIEIGVMKSMSHPNVLFLKDIFQEEDGVYLILELAPEGELFHHIVACGKLTEDNARKVFNQLFQGIKHLHEHNIVHRDIKPENILLADKELSVKLADFGLASFIGDELFTANLCGTPSYVAPEMFAAVHHRRHTRAVDVWSLGVVLYICLSGSPPFSDELYSEEFPYNLSQQIIEGSFEYPSPSWDAVSDLAVDLIDRMLTVDVKERITIDECLKHPWIAATHCSDSH